MATENSRAKREASQKLMGKGVCTGLRGALKILEGKLGGIMQKISEII